MKFEPFPKVSRLSRGMVITEKIDGTNASVHIFKPNDYPYEELPWYIPIEDQGIAVASRTRFISPGKQTDNYGFARWADENASELFRLGPGSHFGEWWGQGIQRRYDLDEKRFSLFNTGRWNVNTLPKCCHLVPVLYKGMFSTAFVDIQLKAMKECGSTAAPGFMKPEGVVIYLSAARKLFKKTIENDEGGKGTQS